MSDPNTHPEDQAADTEPVDPGEVSEDQPDRREEDEDAALLLESDDLAEPIIKP